MHSHVVGITLTYQLCEAKVHLGMVSLLFSCNSANSTQLLHLMQQLRKYSQQDVCLQFANVSMTFVCGIVALQDMCPVNVEHVALDKGRSAFSEQRFARLASVNVSSQTLGHGVPCR